MGSDGDLGSVLQFGISIILFTLIGSWLDRKFGTSPVLLLVGMGLGAGAGFYSMYSKLTASERKRAKDRMADAVDNGRLVAEDVEKRGKV